MPAPGLPPQPEAIPAKANPKSRQAANQIFRYVARFLTDAKGRRKTGNNTHAAEAPGIVSVNTTVVWYIPSGVDDFVMMLTAPVVGE
jgi:hypothetical protein